jgi:hypothetical protein
MPQTTSYNCVLCGVKRAIKPESAMPDYGNSPWPLKPRGKCCDKCNWESVIPARLTISLSK